MIYNNKKYTKVYPLGRQHSALHLKSSSIISLTHYSVNSLQYIEEV